MAKSLGTCGSFTPMHGVGGELCRDTKFLIAFAGAGLIALTAAATAEERPPSKEAASNFHALDKAAQSALLEKLRALHQADYELFGCAVVDKIHYAACLSGVDAVYTMRVSFPLTPKWEFPPFSAPALTELNSTDKGRSATFSSTERAFEKVIGVLSDAARRGYVFVSSIQSFVFSGMSGPPARLMVPASRTAGLNSACPIQGLVYALAVEWINLATNCHAAGALAGAKVWEDTCTKLYDAVNAELAALSGQLFARSAATNAWNALVVSGTPACVAVIARNHLSDGSRMELGTSAASPLNWSGVNVDTLLYAVRAMSQLHCSSVELDAAIDVIILHAGAVVRDDAERMLVILRGMEGLCKLRREGSTSREPLEVMTAALGAADPEVIDLQSTIDNNITALFAVV